MATIKTSKGRKRAPKKSAPKQKIKIIFRDRECDKEHGEVKLQEKTIYSDEIPENGVISPDTGFYGLSKVIINQRFKYCWKRTNGDTINTTEYIYTNSTSQENYNQEPYGCNTLATSFASLIKLDTNRSHIEGGVLTYYTTKYSRFPSGDIL